MAFVFFTIVTILVVFAQTTCFLGLAKIMQMTCIKKAEQDTGVGLSTITASRRTASVATNLQRTILILTTRCGDARHASRYNSISII